MAKLMESLRRFFTLEEENYSSDGLDSESLEAREAPREPEPQPSPRQGQRGNLVSLPTPRKQEIVVLEPASFADAREIAEALKVKKCILLNMRKTDKELARRIVDFLSGISYAIEGNSQKVADNIFLFTPGHMEICFHDPQDSPKGEDMIASGE